MIKSARFLLSCLVLVWHCCAHLPSKVDRAKESFEAYVKALQQDSVEQAKHFWNKPEIERYGMYDWQWAYLTYQKLNPLYLSYRITGTEEMDSYVVLHVEWFYREGKAGPLQKDVRYFIKEDGKMVGANPIFIHSRDWRFVKSRHFVYHHKRKQDQPTGAFLEKMDRFYEKVIDLLQVDYLDKIDYYKCDSTAEVGRLFDLDPSLARSQPINGVVASIQGFVPHEIVHIISYRILPPDENRRPPSYLDEGLAYCLGGASFFSLDLMLNWAKKRLEVNENIDMDSLIRDPWIYGVNEGSSLVSSLIKFLIDTYRMAKFKQLFTADRALDEQKKAIEKIYGKSTDQLQKDWKEFVLALDLPEIKIGQPTDRRELFHVKDPLRDDKGDGDYTYPQNEKAHPGIFDLTDFKIGLDHSMVYFELQSADLPDVEITSDTTFNGTFVAIAVASDDQEKSGNTQLFFGNGNFGFSKKDAYEFVIEVSHAGVLVYDQNWVWQVLFLKADGQQNHIIGNDISFAIPQKIVGIPDSSWKFQVLSGGQKGGYKNTAYGVGQFMKVGEEATPDQGGGGTNSNFNPNVYDMLTPRGMDQVKILSNYSVAQRKKTVIPMMHLEKR